MKCIQVYKFIIYSSSFLLSANKQLQFTCRVANYRLWGCSLFDELKCMKLIYACYSDYTLRWSMVLLEVTWQSDTVWILANFSHAWRIELFWETIKFSLQYSCLLLQISDVILTFWCTKNSDKYLLPCQIYPNYIHDIFGLSFPVNCFSLEIDK